MSGSVDVYRASQAKALMREGDPKPPAIRSSNVLHSMKSKHLKTSYLDSNPIQAMDIMKYTTQSNNIHDIGHDPFYVNYWTAEQIRGYKRVCKKYRATIYIDSTGLKV